METKRPFARIAGWAALWLSVVAMILFLVPLLTKPAQATVPPVYAMALVTLSALGVFVCVLCSVVCGVIALCGMRKHGRKGILLPASSGLFLAVLMLIPILFGLASGFAEHARLVKAREVHTPPAAPAPQR